MVDIDTGFGPSAFNIERTVKSLIKAGAAACHIEDQVGAKRCGHRPGKEIVSTAEMADRVKAAADARTDRDFFSAEHVLDPEFIKTLPEDKRAKYLGDVQFSSYCAVPP